jgi:hypothetical protein
MASFHKKNSAVGKCTSRSVVGRSFIPTPESGEPVLKWTLKSMLPAHDRFLPDVFPFRVDRTTREKGSEYNGRN